MRFLVIQKPGLLTSLSRPKCCWTFAPHHDEASGQPTTCIPCFSGDIRSIQPCFSPRDEQTHCVLPAQEFWWQTRLEANDTTSKPLEEPSCLVESQMALFNHFSHSDGEMKGTKDGDQSLIHSCSGRKCRERGKNRSGKEERWWSMHKIWFWIGDLRWGVSDHVSASES